MLVVAGPGAGKTFCLIARIAHLIARHGLEPRRICAVTFTNKAADEIADAAPARDRPARRGRSPGARCTRSASPCCATTRPRPASGAASASPTRTTSAASSAGSGSGRAARPAAPALRPPPAPARAAHRRRPGAVPGLPRGSPRPQPARLRRPRRPHRASCSATHADVAAPRSGPAGTTCWWTSSRT